MAARQTYPLGERQAPYILGHDGDELDRLIDQARFFGDLTDDLDSMRGLNGLAGQSYVDKDLRTMLHQPVRGPYHLRYCGNGSLDACRTALWAVVDQVAQQLAAAQGPDPSVWRSTARRQGFTPGLIPDTIRATNRPTFQQVLELQGR